MKLCLMQAECIRIKTNNRLAIKHSKNYLIQLSICLPNNEKTSFNMTSSKRNENY